MHNVGKIEEKHAFGVRLFWIIITISLVVGIYAIYAGRALDAQDRRLLSYQYSICIKSTYTRNKVLIPNAVAEKKLYSHFQKVDASGILAAKIILKDPKQSKTAKLAARVRIKGFQSFSDVLPHVVVPPVYPPCIQHP